jgi:dTDP-4-dehydrorhamnose 3,5-epimerase
MSVTSLAVKGAWLVEPKRHADDRGWFQEWFKQSAVREATGYLFEPVQTNISKSAAGVIRGIHYSIAARGQGKLVTVMSGAIDDYVIDINPSSSTFGTWVRERLTADNGRAMLIGPHMGHAFQALTDDTVVSYLVTAEFDPQSEKGISPFCPEIGIEWDEALPRLVSDKDVAAPTLGQQAAAGQLPPN